MREELYCERRAQKVKIVCELCPTVWDIISEIPQECGCWPDAASNPGVPYQFTPFNLCANYAPQEYAFYVVGLAHCRKANKVIFVQFSVPKMAFTLTSI